MCVTHKLDCRNVGLHKTLEKVHQRSVAVNSYFDTVKHHGRAANMGGGETLSMTHDWSPFNWKFPSVKLISSKA